jgi:excisionase family DNA binding protein
MDTYGVSWHHERVSDRPYRTAAEVASELGVSLRTVRRWVANGRLPATRVGRSVRIPVDSYRGVARIGEVPTEYLSEGTATAWPDTPDRLAEQRRQAAAVMDRLAAQGRPATGAPDTADAILDAAREDDATRGRSTR